MMQEKGTKSLLVRVKALVFMVPFIVLPFFLFAEKDPKAGPITLFLTVPFALLLIMLFAGKGLIDLLVVLMKEKPASFLAGAILEMAVVVTAFVWFFMAG